jgi:chromosome segregation ATPase
VKQFLAAQAARLEKKSRKLKALKREAADISRRLASVEEDYSVSRENLERQLEEAINNANLAKTDAEALGKENRQLLKDLEAANRVRTELEVEIDQIREDQSHIRFLDTQKNLENLQHELATLQSEYDKLAEQSQEENSQLKSANHSLRVEVKSMDAEIKSIQSNAETAIQELTNRLEAEKSVVVTSYESQMAQLREQCESQGIDLERVAALLSQSEEAGRNLKRENEEFSKKLVKVSSSLRSLKASTAKENKLLELKATTERVELETEYITKLDQLKARTDAEKRRVYGYGVDAFKRFVNPLQGIDEKSFKNVMLEVKKELERLAASDSAIRRLVNANANQTTEDAVARLYLGGL